MPKMTERAIWKVLTVHKQRLCQSSLQTLFSASTDRFTEFSINVAGLFVDYSKNFITAETIRFLCQLAEEKQLSRSIHALFSGEKVNHTEGRAALHTALRLPMGQALSVNQETITANIHATLQKMAKLVTQLQWVKTVLHVGVGGSDLGPALYYDVMKGFAKPRIGCHFLSAFDAHVIANILNDCDPKTTLVIVASKSFSTQETLLIAEMIQQWLVNALGDHAQTHYYAVTANNHRALQKGFLSENILPIWDWVGGRYSIWSAVNFANVLAFGIESFQQFLQGAHQIDKHFQHTAFHSNLPVILGLLSVWYNNFFHAHSKAIIPYSAQLRLLPAYLQQLHMESLGKSVNVNGEAIDYATGRVVWGDVGPNSQHSFHQLLMQGSQMIPVDFILPLSEKMNAFDRQRVVHCLSQSHTLMSGFDAAENHKKISGNRPSTTVLISKFTPATFGALLALYEHQVFVQSVLWEINAFDQWGVERGKQVSQLLNAYLLGDNHQLSVDNSTEGLLQKIKEVVA